jgi:hypothetical protein
MIDECGKGIGKGILLPLLLCFTLIAWWGCGEGPTKSDVKPENKYPETKITSKTLTKVELETDTLGAVINFGEFAFTVEYTGTDLDGTVDSFAVSLDRGPWTAWTNKKSYSGTFDFSSADDEHTVEVKSKDNEGLEDPTPAYTALTVSEAKANSLPTTAFVSGPTEGSTTGRAVKFQISGSDEDGEVVNFIYSIDGGDELTLEADAEGKAEIEFSNALGNILALGNHTISVRSVDNLGGEDLTPATVSFFVGQGFQPILSQTDGPPPGGGWFTGANIPFAWSSTTSHYFGVIDHYEYSVDDPVNFLTTTSAGVSLDPLEAGGHVFRLKGIDTGGNASDILEVSFNVALFAPTEGILFIDNVSFTMGPYSSEPEMDQMILDGFFQNFTNVSVWDVDRLSGGNRFPDAINATSLPGPEDLARFSSVVIMTDGGYTIDDVSPLLAAYFQAGGNLMVTGYLTADFGQVLKDVMGTPDIFNGYGTNFLSLEGFQTAEGNNSDAYAFITGDDVVPVVPGESSRSWEITTNVTPNSYRVMFANVGPGGAYGGYRIATEVQGEKGNWGLWIGVSLCYLDQTSTGIVKLGDFVLGDRFGEN